MKIHRIFGGIVKALWQDDGNEFKRALITGGAGFIGSNIVKRLLELGREAVVFDNLASGYRENLSPSSEFIEGDVLDYESVGQAMSGCDLVFHLAASVGNKRSIEDPISDSSVNLLGTINILEAARKHGIGRVVFSSSAGIYGETTSLPVSEDTLPSPDSPYGTSKLAAEKMCFVYNKLYGMRNICLRYFNVYGRNQRYDAYGNVIPIFVCHALQGMPLTIYGDGKQTRDFVNVDDVIAANLQAACSIRNTTGVFNIASGSRVTVEYLAKLILEISGAKVDITYDHPRPGDVRDSQADIAKAHEALGFSPSVSLEDGLRQYIDWIRKDPITVVQMERRP